MTLFLVIMSSVTGELKNLSSQQQDIPAQQSGILKRERKRWGTICCFLLLRAALLVSSRISAARYSSTVVRYTIKRKKEMENNALFLVIMSSITSELENLFQHSSQVY
jgi:hypothetical protein